MQHRVEIALDDREGWKQWIECFAQMVDELRSLTIPSVDEILDKYECRRCDYGAGLNIDWPSKPDAGASA